MVKRLPSSLAAARLLGGLAGGLCAKALASMPLWSWSYRNIKLQQGQSQYHALLRNSSNIWIAAVHVFLIWMQYLFIRLPRSCNTAPVLAA